MNMLRSSTDPPKIQIFATDIDETALAAARAGRYPQTIALDVSPERLRKYFVPDGDFYRVRKEVRELVLFAPHNVLRDPPFSKLDLVSCRNLLIYLNREIQERVLATFHFSMLPSAYLFLGASESAESASPRFIEFNKKFHTYTRRPQVTALPVAPAQVDFSRWNFQHIAPSEVSLRTDGGVRRTPPADSRKTGAAELPDRSGIRHRSHQRSCRALPPDTRWRADAQFA